MPKNEDIQKHTLNLRAGDWDFLESVYRARGISTSQVIRMLVSNFVDKTKGKLAQPENPTDVGVDL